MYLLFGFFLFTYNVFPLLYRNFEDYPITFSLTFIFAVSYLVTLLLVDRKSGLNTYYTRPKFQDLATKARFTPLILEYIPLITLISMVLLACVYGWYSYNENFLSRRFGDAGNIVVILRMESLTYYIIRLSDFLFLSLSLSLLVVYRIKQNNLFLLFACIFLVVHVVFAGVLDQRVTLFTLVACITIIFGYHDLKKLFSLKVLFVGILLSGYLAYVSAYLRPDFNLSTALTRIDGILLLTKLEDLSLLDPLGTFDFSGYIYSLSNFPFLEIAREFKSEGTTSYKGYILRDVLHWPTYDCITSIILDFAYVLGLAGVAFLGLFFGGLMIKLDALIDDIGNKNVLNPFILAIVPGFPALQYFETDIVGVIKNFSVLYVMSVMLISILMINGDGLFQRLSKEDIV